MKWAVAPMIDIPEDEQKNYPNNGGGFYTKRIDTDNPKVYNEFILGMNFVSKKMKEQSPPSTQVKLPKLKKA